MKWMYNTSENSSQDDFSFFFSRWRLEEIFRVATSAHYIMSEETMAKRFMVTSKSA